MLGIPALEIIQFGIADLGLRILDLSDNPVQPASKISEIVDSDIGFQSILISDPVNIPNPKSQIEKPATRLFLLNRKRHCGTIPTDDRYQNRQ